MGVSAHRFEASNGHQYDGGNCSFAAILWEAQHG